MTAEILAFPKNFKRTTSLGVSINLYSEEEVDMVLFCLNIFGNKETIHTKEDLRFADPVYTLICMKEAYKSYLLSPDAKSIIHYIMKNVSEVTSSIKGGSA